MSTSTKPATSFAGSDFWDVRKMPSISSIFSKLLTELEGSFQAGMFLYSGTDLCSQLPSSDSSKVFISVDLQIMGCSALLVCLTSSEHFSVKFCTLV